MLATATFFFSSKFVENVENRTKKGKIHIALGRRSATLIIAHRCLRANANNNNTARREAENSPAAAAQTQVTRWCSPEVMRRRARCRFRTSGNGSRSTGIDLKTERRGTGGGVEPAHTCRPHQQQNSLSGKNKRTVAVSVLLRRTAGQKRGE